MVARGVQWMAVLATMIVVAGFTLFAVEEMGGASERQQAALTESVNSGSAATQPASQPAQSRVRSTLDQANEALLGPFAGLAQSDNPWVERGVPTLLALALYGAGLGFLARYVRSRA
jgi:hypothetical protein